METLDEVLAHYGILGMKWGVRRDRKQLARARGERLKKGKPVTPTKQSQDAAKASAALKKAKKGGVKALSNQELQELNKRLNLETEYSRLNDKNKEVSLGKRASKKLLNEAGGMAANVARGEAQRILAIQVRKKVLGG